MTYTNEELTEFVNSLVKSIALLQKIVEADETELENHEKRIRKLEGLK